MVLLLGSRGRGRARNKSAFWSAARGVWQSAFGRVGSDRTHGRSRAAAPWKLVAVALACFAAGFLTGGEVQKRTALAPDTGLPVNGALQASGQGARAPGVIGEVETSPLTNQAFVVAAWPGVEAEAALASARSLSERLRAKGLKKARPYEFPSARGPLWVVAVYFDGTAEMASTRDRLVGLTDEEVADATFVHQRKSTQDWPPMQDIR